MSFSKECWTSPRQGLEMAAGRSPLHHRRPEFSLSTPSPTSSPQPRDTLRPERPGLVPNASPFYFNKDAKLAQELMAKMTNSAHTRIGNIPRKDLVNMLSLEVVQYELRGLAGKRTVKEIAEKITTPRLNCQGVFAILILMGKTSQILGFVNQTFPTIPIHQDCGMLDYDLPLVMVYDESKSKIVLRREDYPEAHLDCFDEFTPEEVVAFEQWQWSVLDEKYFDSLTSGIANNRYERWHYNYSANDQLPIMKPTGPPNSAFTQTMIGKGTYRAGRNGGISLWTLTDPTRTRPFPEAPGNIHRNRQFVAVKQPRTARSFLFERRAAALISAVPHPHIVPLLFSYSHLNKSYLVFPWATSNLAEFWEANKLYLQDRSTMEYPLVLWVAEQCEGLADALRYIHRFVSTSRNDDTKMLHSDGFAFHGRETFFVGSHHGDIKPENILVFCGPHRPPVLQLADFGKSSCTTGYHHNGALTYAHHRAGDYTAPEVYLGEPASTKSDVWSLCCVFLDFIEWIMPSQSAPGQPRRVLADSDEAGMYVQGREAFRDWRRSRAKSGSGNVEGYFFDTSTGELSLWIDTWLHDAQDNELCSRWMCELVGYLDEHILQQDAEHRISSRALYAGLLDLRMSCQHPVNGRRFAIEPINT